MVQVPNLLATGGDRAGRPVFRAKRAPARKKPFAVVLYGPCEARGYIKNVLQAK